MISKVFLLTLTAVALSLVVHAQSAPSDLIASLDRELVESVKQGNFEIARTISERLVAASANQYGAESMQHATALANLGSIQRRVENYSGAAETFDRALQLYRKLAPEKVNYQISMLESIAYCKARAKDLEGAESKYREAVDLVEDGKVKLGREHFAVYLGAANNAALLKNFDLAHKFYLKANELAFGFFDVDSAEREELLISRTCFFRTQSNAKPFEKEFDDAQKRLSENESTSGKAEAGRAVSLPKPPYSPVARAMGLRGAVFVRVAIDAQGHVTDASAICSNAILSPGAVAAAKASRFSPTLKNGRPIPVIGLLSYYFTY